MREEKGEIMLYCMYVYAWKCGGRGITDLVFGSTNKPTYLYATNTIIILHLHFPNFAPE